MGRNRSNATAPAVKGDLVAGTGTNTSGVLALGNNGDTIVADSSTSTGLSYQANFAAGKNKIINGDFGVNQRNFSSSTSDYLYTFDRLGFYRVGGSATITAQTFTPGTAPVAGYEGRNFFRCAAVGSAGSNDRSQSYYLIESVRTFAGQTATLSFWARAASGTPKLGVGLEQIFGTGGSGGVVVPGSTLTLSTSWARYSVTFTVPSISGKTIGTGDYLSLNLIYTAGSGLDSYYGTSVGVQTATIDIWGLQMENGATATAFQTATGTIQGELAACQRYYWQYNGSTNVQYFSNAFGYNSTSLYGVMKLPVTMRSNPSFSAVNPTAGLAWNATTILTATNITMTNADPNSPLVLFTFASGVSSNQSSMLGLGNTGVMQFSAEL